MTQQNAALVEQSAAAAESLREQAQKLAQAVSVFKLGHQVVPVAPRVAPPAPARARAPVVAAPSAPRRLAQAPRLRVVGNTPAAPAAGARPQRERPAEDWESF